MSIIHDQAMNYVYQQVLQRLLSFFSREERTALQLLIQRLVVAAGGMERIGHYKVLLAHPGTRDSCYTLALLRAAQLNIAGRAPATFQIRVATLHLGATTPACIENVHRSYSALFIYDDPRVEVLMVDHREVLPFNHLASLSETGREMNRINLLMLGHLRGPAGVFETCDDGYLAMAEFYGHMVRWEGGVDAMVGGETARQQKQFIAGLTRGAQKIGLSFASHPPQGFEGLFSMLDQLGGDVYREVYADIDTAQWRPREGFNARRGTAYLDIQDLVPDNMEDRWPLLTDFLGLQPEEIETHLRENDYASPLLSAHMRGLQGAYLRGQTYERGFSEYVQRALLMMRRRRLPERLCDQVLVQYGGAQAIAEQRSKADIETQQTLGLNEAQLLCLLFAPFVDKAARLEEFLRRCHPGMLVAMPDLHNLMQGHVVAEQIRQWVVDVSGLSIDLICRVYRTESVVGTELEILEQAAVIDGASGAHTPGERYLRR
ncbi:hypothetical protein SAMN04487857_102109 [Pseudomonas sp. ok272]|uniref:hypothetical protein n=1 Tax=unclassified Pseudomonas TaxID=196821 RepID=UPI0008AE4AB4|nr:MULTISPECIES: hypothetical protein [unclassified Pseudomonas]SEM46112.1 hypothetical protein SAMN04487857_102109 [Pseudomonas sp. ok272]SFM17844.1 hypothetical protein SAMN04487858_101110 [Pseudomonas sp. ok602]